jgi:glycine hydroxymethyltransferase
MYVCMYVMYQHSCMMSSRLSIHLFIHQNAVLGDKSALTPGGVRIGSPALTTRGLTEAHFRSVADFLHRAACIAQSISSNAEAPTLKAFEEGVRGSEEVRALKEDVLAFAAQFPMPGLIY